MAQLSRQGYSPYVVEVHGSRGVLHLVRVGRYPDRGTATHAASELRRKARMEAIVQPMISKAREASPESGPAEGGEKPATSG
jgi:cell division septation protein DedD